jgi:hypothetical protein
MLNFKRHTPLAHAAYHDLLRSLKDDAVSYFRGTPVKKTRGGQSFWYDSYRIGTGVKTHYIGPDTDELRQRLARFEELRQGREERQRERQRLIRILRAEYFLGVDAGTGSLLSALATAGTFRLGGTIVGTHAFRLYEGELGVRMSFDQAVTTSDIDIAAFERLSLALDDTTSPALNDVLKDLKFSAVPSLKPEQVWRWQQTGGELLVEFLTPSFTDDEGVRNLPSLGIHAQSLHHLNFLIADPIAAVVTYRSGILVQIPRPERFAIHKLIVADRRLSGSDAMKAQKDLIQAELLISILAEDRPDELAEAYRLALDSGPQWQMRLEASLRKRPAISERLASISS